MKVEVLHYTPLDICSQAIRTCWDSHDKSDSTGYMFRAEGDRVYADTVDKCPIDQSDYVVCGEKDKALIERVGNKNKHSSTLEHLSYAFYISGVSRALLQELARHRMASLSVKSTRYTLKELKNNCSLYNTNQAEGLTWRMDEVSKFCVLTINNEVNKSIAEALSNLKALLEDGISNDVVKYALPEAYKTELTWTINARSLQNFLSLRTSPSALLEIRNLAYTIFEQLPEEHKYLFEDNLYKEN